MKWWPFNKEPTPSTPPPAPPARTLEEVLGEDYPAVEALSRPRIRLVSAAGAGKSPAGRTKLGGLPDMPSGTDWPTLKGNPLSFVAQVDLGAIAGLPGSEVLPAEGLLLFFYDWDLQYGDVLNERVGFWRVIHATGPLSPREFPPATHEMARFEEVKLSAVADTQLPNPESLGYLISLEDDVLDEYGDVYYELPRTEDPLHQLFGFPEPVQDDPFAECQIDSNALCEGGRKGALDPAWQTLKKGVKDWRLLLQVDSDDAAGMMWGDVGILYFCIREDDLKKADFEKVWMIFQCS
ncbi:MAG TPA: YwqG family protein [Fimbriimonadaceae bacterium]|nr:YwqG family protein [Fimbriimonadaceae bacterium]